jgi:rhodanese-related sulfurtransferase
MAEYIEPADLLQWLQSSSPPLVVDVRIGQVGQIPGAIHVPVLDLEDKPADWDRARDIVVFCQFGKGASEYAAEVLEEQGFSKVYKLRGGMDALARFLQGLADDTAP